MKDINNDFVVVVVVEGILDPKDKLHNNCHFPKKDLGSAALIARTDN